MKKKRKRKRKKEKSSHQNVEILFGTKTNFSEIKLKTKNQNIVKLNNNKKKEGGFESDNDIFNLIFKLLIDRSVALFGVCSEEGTGGGGKKMLYNASRKKFGYFCVQLSFQSYFKGGRLDLQTKIKTKIKNYWNETQITIVLAH